ncbi:MAG: hypothetical protein ABI232_02135 [Jatrophihabitantaceae bacterium]
MPTEATDAKRTDPDSTAVNPTDEPTVQRAVQATSRARRIGGRAASVGAPSEKPSTDDDPSGPRLGKSAARVAADRHASETTDAPGDEPTVNLVKAPRPKKSKVARGGPERSEPVSGPSPRRFGRRWLAWTAATVAVIAALVLGTFSVTSSHRVWWGKSSQDVTANRTEVLAAAKSCIAKLNTYDYQTLDKAESDGLGCTTGAFTAQYKTAFETQIKVLAPQQKASQTFQVNDAGIERVSTDRSQWDVLVFGQISTTNSTTPANAPKLSVLSAVVHMQQVGENWLVSGYTYAPRS